MDAPEAGLAGACGAYFLPTSLPPASFTLIWNNTLAIALFCLLIASVFPDIADPVTTFILGSFVRDPVRRALQLQRNANRTGRPQGGPEPMDTTMRQAMYLHAFLKPGVEHGILFAAVQLCTVLLEKVSTATYFWSVSRPSVGFVSGWMSGLGLLALYAAGVLLHYGSTIGLLLYSLHGLGVAIGLAIYIFTTVLYYVGTGPAGAFCSLVELVVLLLRQMATSPAFALRTVAFGAFATVAPLFTSIIVFRRRGDRGDWSGLGVALALCLALNAAIVTVSSTVGFRLSVELTAASRGTSLCSCGQEPSMAGWLRSALTAALFLFVGLVGYPFLRAAGMIARKASLLRYDWKANVIGEKEFRDRHMRWRVPAQWRALWRRVQLLGATASSALGWVATAARYAFGLAAAMARDDPDAAAGMSGLLGGLVSFVNGLLEEVGATFMTALQYAMQMINLLNQAGDAARAAARTLNSRSLAFDVAAYPVFARAEAEIVDRVPEPDFSGVELRLVSYTHRTALGGTLPLPRALWHRRPLASVQLSSGATYISGGAGPGHEPIVVDDVEFARQQRLPVYASCRVYMAAVSRLLRRMEQRAEVPPALQMAGLWRAHLNDVRETESGGAGAAAAAAEADAAAAEIAAASSDDFLGLGPDAAHWFFHQPVEGAPAAAAASGLPSATAASAAGGAASSGAAPRPDGGVATVASARRSGPAAALAPFAQLLDPAGPAGILFSGAAAGLQAGHGEVAAVARAAEERERDEEAARREETRAFPPLPDDSSVAAEDDDRDAWEVDDEDVLHGDWTAARAVEAAAAAEAEAAGMPQRLRNSAAIAARAAVTFSGGVANRVANTAADRAVGLQWAGERGMALLRGLYDSAATAVANAATSGLAAGAEAEAGPGSWWRPFGESAAAALSAARGDFRGILTHMTHTASVGMQWLLGSPAGEGAGAAGAGAGAAGAGAGAAGGGAGGRNIGCIARMRLAVQRSTLVRVLAYCGVIPISWTARANGTGRRGTHYASAAGAPRRSFSAPVMDAVRGLLRWDASADSGAGTGVFVELELVLSDRESVPLEGPAARGILGAAAFTGGSIKLRFPLLGYSSAGGWHGALVTDRVLRSVLGRVVAGVDSHRRHILVDLYSQPLLARQPSLPHGFLRAATTAPASSAGGTDSLLEVCMRGALQSAPVIDAFRALYGCEPGVAGEIAIHRRVLDAAADGCGQSAGSTAGEASGVSAGDVNPQEAGLAAFVLWQLHRCTGVPTRFEDDLRVASQSRAGATHQVLLRTALSQFEAAVGPLLRLYVAESELMDALTIALEAELRTRQAAGADATGMPPSQVRGMAGTADAETSTSEAERGSSPVRSVGTSVAAASTDAADPAAAASAATADVFGAAASASELGASASGTSSAAGSTPKTRAEAGVGTSDDADELLGAGSGVRAVAARVRGRVSRAARAAASLPAAALEALDDWRSTHGLWSVALLDFLQRFAIAYVEAAARARRYAEEAAASANARAREEADASRAAAASAAAAAPAVRGRWANGGRVSAPVGPAEAARLVRAGAVPPASEHLRRRHGGASADSAAVEAAPAGDAAAGQNQAAGSQSRAASELEPPRRIDDITGPELLARLICLASAAAVAALMRTDATTRR